MRRRFYGIDNWRGDLLRRYWRPDEDLGKLIEAGWFESAAAGFEDEPEFPATPPMAGEEDRAWGDAKMRYLLLYLQQQGALGALYHSLHDLSITDRASKGHDVAVLERLTRQSVQHLDGKLKDFTETMKNTAQQQLPTSCRERAIQIRKDIPAPPTEQ